MHQWKNLEVSGGQPFGQESINVFEWQKKAMGPSVVPSVAGAGPLHSGDCWLQQSRAAILSFLRLWTAAQSGLGALCWCSSTEATWKGWFCGVVFSCTGCSGEGGCPSDITERWLLSGNVGILLLVPVQAGRSPAASRMDARSAELPVKSSPG